MINNVNNVEVAYVALNNRVNSIRKEAKSCVSKLRERFYSREEAIAIEELREYSVHPLPLSEPRAGGVIEGDPEEETWYKCEAEAATER